MQLLCTVGHTFFSTCAQSCSYGDKESIIWDLPHQHPNISEQKQYFYQLNLQASSVRTFYLLLCSITAAGFYQQVRQVVEHQDSSILSNLLKQDCYNTCHSSNSREDPFRGLSDLWKSNGCRKHHLARIEPLRKCVFKSVFHYRSRGERYMLPSHFIHLVLALLLVRLSWSVRKGQGRRPEDGLDQWSTLA